MNDFQRLVASYLFEYSDTTREVSDCNQTRLIRAWRCPVLIIGSRFHCC